MKKLNVLLSGLVLVLSSLIFNPVFAEDGPVNVNTATVEQLDTLERIGPKTAKAIVQYREKNGPFKTFEDFDKVYRIGPKTIEANKDRIKFK
jgi:competence protein ComEA